MNIQNQNGYMLLFRGNDWLKNLSSEEKQKVTDQWMAWFRRLTDEGKAIAGNPLERDSKIVSGKNRVVSDGPFAEFEGGNRRLFSSRRREFRRSGGDRENAPDYLMVSKWR